MSCLHVVFPLIQIREFYRRTYYINEGKHVLRWSTELRVLHNIDLPTSFSGRISR